MLSWSGWQHLNLYMTAVWLFITAVGILSNSFITKAAKNSADVKTQACKCKTHRRLLFESEGNDFCQFVREKVFRVMPCFTNTSQVAHQHHGTKQRKEIYIYKIDNAGCCCSSAHAVNSELNVCTRRRSRRHFSMKWDCVLDCPKGGDFRTRKERIFIHGTSPIIKYTS